MDEKLTELSEEMTAAARHIVQCHIDQLNKDYAQVVAGIDAESAKFNTFSKRSTYIIWALFWISGFLARGLFQGPVDWNLASFATGISTGVLVYWGVYGVIHTIVLRRWRKL